MTASDHSGESGRSALWRAGPGLFSVLRHRDFRYVWSSQMLHLWGNEMENLVLAWFVLVETDSPLLVGLIGAVRFGGTLLAPYYGAVVDRFDRRNIQVFSQALSVVLASTLMTLVLTDVFVTWHAFVIVSLSSFASTLGIVANQALSADTVPSKQLNSAMGLNRATIDFARITGSLLGGGLMSALGLGPAYIGVVALYVASTLAAALISRQGTLRSNSEDGSEEQAGYLKHISQGVGYVREHSILAGLLFFAFLIEFTTFPLVNELMTVLGEELFDADENGIGIMRAVASGGALLGALITGCSTDNRESLSSAAHIRNDLAPVNSSAGHRRFAGDCSSHPVRMGHIRGHLLRCAHGRSPAAHKHRNARARDGIASAGGLRSANGTVDGRVAC